MAAWGHPWAFSLFSEQSGQEQAVLAFFAPQSGLHFGAPCRWLSQPVSEKCSARSSEARDRARNGSLIVSDKAISGETDDSTDFIILTQ
jgi:hypothetical protein